MEHEYTEGKDSCLKAERCRNPIECLSWKGALLIHRKRSPFPAGEGKDATPLITPTNTNLKPSHPLTRELPQRGSLCKASHSGRGGTRSVTERILHHTDKSPI